MRCRFAFVLAAAVAATGFGHLAAASDKLSSTDQAAYRAAFAAVAAEKWGEARSLALKGKNPLPAKVIQWLDLTRPGPGRSFGELSQFLRDNPDWPGQDALRAQAERSMLTALPAETAIAWFGNRAPLTLEGAQRLAHALATQGDKAGAAAVARKGWVGQDARDEAAETLFLAEFAGLLRAEDNVARLDRLLWDNKHVAARRVMARVDSGHKALGEARLALRNAAGNADAAVGRVPQKLLNDPGLVFERARWRRRNDQFETIPALFEQPLAGIGRPEIMWREIDDAARRALNRGQAKTAYRLARNHGATEGTTFAEGEWLAGWIALRFLNDPQTAYTHFTWMYDKVGSAISKARGAYWAGRAAEAQKQSAQAQKWYSDAAGWTTTYYGQLAAHRLGQDGPLQFPAVPEPTKEQRAAFAKNELARVVQVLGLLGEAERTRTFLTRLIDLSASPAEHRMVVELAGTLGRDDLMVAAAKSARAAGTELVELLYPVRQIQGDAPEKALVLAVIRQESAFDHTAVSSAGARGLMQLMPATGKGVAKKLGLGFSPAKLNDPAYNITLGRSYLNSLLEDYGGSYVLSIAGYNAGPRRVSEFIGQNRDPRRKGVDVIDWVESIPLSETRNYVQRVLENVQVYRQRLGGTQLALSLEQDLNR